jgi:uncharacterized membrane protein YsdA (DUF1294 family)
MPETSTPSLGFVRRYLLHGVFSTVYVLLGLRLFEIIDRYSVNLFTWDQWGFNDATLFQRHSLWQIFRWQWGPHRLGIGGVLSRLLEPFGSWNSRYEAFGIGVIIFATSVAALWLKKRLFGNIVYQDLIIPLIFLTPSQHEMLVEAEGPTPFALPLMLAISYCICWTLTSGKWKYPGILATNFLLIYTGYGILMGVITPVLILLDWNRNRSEGTHNRGGVYGISFAVSVASLCSFFAGYRHLPTMGCPASLSISPVKYFWFTSILFARFAGLKASQSLVPAIIAGGAMSVFALFAVFFLVRRLFFEEASVWKISLSALALLSYTMLFAAAAATGRQCLGLRVAESSRYVTPLIFGFLGLYFGALSMRSKHRRVFYVSLLWIIALLGSARIDRDEYIALNAYSTGKRAWKECYLTTHDVQRCTAQTQFYVIPRLDHAFIDEDALRHKLDFLERNHLNLFSDPTHSSYPRPPIHKNSLSIPTI